MKSIQERNASTPLYGGSAPFVESLYAAWLENPAAVSAEWRNYFERNGVRGDRTRMPVEQELAARATSRRAIAIAGSATGGADGAAQRLLDAWRLSGHRCAHVDPLELSLIPRIPELDPSAFGLSASDLRETVETDWGGTRDHRLLDDLYAHMQQVYSGTFAAEFAYISEPIERRWLTERIEGGNSTFELDDGNRLLVLAELTAAEGLERYLHRRYVGQKRFSLEGGDTLIPLLNDLIRSAGRDGVKEIICGMAHRGRLNVLVNVLGKSPSDLFSEFEGHHESGTGSGDVKYHLGFSSDVETDGARVHLVLAFNPSHLEAVDPVVEGSVRARQDRDDDRRGQYVLPVLIHGDASLAGQGVVMETLQMSQTNGFGTGGTVHIVINNQIGFTISDPHDARSSRHCSDVAKMLESPVFHVNGDDPEAALMAIRLAFAYRQRFGKDVFVDLVCYRRQGHNEADEPAVTQPRMYRVIRSHPTPRALYAERLAATGVVDAAGADALLNGYNTSLEKGRVLERTTLRHIEGEFTRIDWRPFKGKRWEQKVETGVAVERLRELGERLCELPEGFEPHDRAARVISERRKMIAGDIPLDWGCAENLCYASLVVAGHAVRLTGQDSVRGTFFHRHAAFYDKDTAARWSPLQHLAKDQAPFMVYDSLLSEGAVVGFEYGYATARPNTLVLWEAQYGDFANGAQVMIDQFISSGEAKWNRLCSLTLLLPHGYEGAGPEHSSARLERYLQLCAGNNMQVCVPTTAAQIFHLLRRQVVREFRAPLIVMSPKSLLRHKLANSTLDALANGHFQLIIPETEKRDASRVRRVVFCSGKVYYELAERRTREKMDNVAIVRIEQLYPFPSEEYAAVLGQYKQAQDIVWSQEEPENQGAWYQIRHRLQAALNPHQTLVYAGREASAAPATGYAKQHRIEEQALIEDALGLGIQSQTRSKVKAMESK